MVDAGRYVDGKIYGIENRLKNSFGALKKNNDVINEKLAFLREAMKNEVEGIMGEMERLRKENVLVREENARLESLFRKCRTEEVLKGINKMEREVDGVRKEFVKESRVFAKKIGEVSGLRKEVARKMGADEGEVLRGEMSSKMEADEGERLRKEMFNANLVLVGEMNRIKDRLGIK